MKRYSIAKVPNGWIVTLTSDGCPVPDEDKVHATRQAAEQRRAELEALAK